jgi:nucleoid-associated protein Lsr2
MATRITVELQDDIDGGPADETVRFGLDGRDYEIDLSKANARAFRRQLASFLVHARRAGQGRRRRPGRAPASHRRGDGIRT